MLKRELPVTHCTQCGGVGYNSRVADRRCSKTIAGERCGGTNANALNRSDWEDCSYCEATGYYRIKTVRNAKVSAIFSCVRKKSRLSFNGNRSCQYPGSKIRKSLRLTPPMLVMVAIQARR